MTLTGSRRPLGLGRSRGVVWALVLTAIAGLSACSMLLSPKKRTVEQRSAKFSGSTYKVIAVIAGDDSRGALRMSVMVRAKLREGGLQAIPRTGRWSVESEAMADICPAGEAVNVDGVLFVYYNQLSLFDCRSRALAYQVEGGDDLGIEGMAKRLIDYLRSGSNESAPAGARGQ